MERTSKLADLKLVSKYYPVANYSYPQPDRRSHNGHSQSRGSNASSRASLGSDGSVPGLIDDRTDSEVSLDDDYQYHTHATELWDSFWKPGAEAKSPELELQPRKQYPALIPSPQQRKRLGLEERRIPAWPLPEGPRPRSRKAAATYSPFPRLIPLPPRTSSLVPSWQCSRSKQTPQRPPRPDENSPVLGHFATSPEAYKTNFSRPVTPGDHHPKTSLDIRSTSSLERHLSIYLTTSQSATNLSLLDSQPITHAMASKKSAPSLQSIPRGSDPEPQLLSVFEYDDSDSESESEDSRALSFFRFHKRGSSDSRRATKSTESGHWRRRRKRQGGDVLGRMLGRRSR
ncbi:hypothetical protein EDB80DRAFT_746102 [Ilyonectria destructans]|nr:hypothetical protein EDB80DRAFT_746102 [Ilyonectria destructans]